MAFRLKCKKYVKDGREFLVSHAMGTGASGTVLVFLMSDDETPPVPMLVDEYNALPYHWFEDMGPAPRGTAVKPTEV
jgi:hypothetical protein